jgi:hypothetical protein
MGVCNFNSTACCHAVDAAVKSGNSPPTVWFTLLHATAETRTAANFATVFLRCEVAIAAAYRRRRGEGGRSWCPTEWSLQAVRTICIRVDTYVDLQLWVKKIAV